MHEQEKSRRFYGMNILLVLCLQFSLKAPHFLQITLKQDGNGKIVFQSNLQDKGLIFACVEI